VVAHERHHVGVDRDAAKDGHFDAGPDVGTEISVMTLRAVGVLDARRRESQPANR